MKSAYLSMRSRISLRISTSMLSGGSGSGKLALIILLNHGEASAQQISQVIGKIRIDPRYQRLFAEFGIKAEDHFPQKKYLKASSP